MPKDYYNILGVDKKADPEEIKKAFHKKAHQYHPDKSGGDTEKFKEINEAYQILSNPQKRAQYDQFGAAFEQGGFSGWQGGPFGSAQGGQGWNFDMNNLGDLFSNFSGFGDIFGGGRQSSRRPNSGADIEAVLLLNLTETVLGAAKEISLRKTVNCQHCRGNGAEPGSKIETCSACHGSGRVTKNTRTILGNIQLQSACASCNGSGKTFSQKCRDCNGQGLVKDKVTLEVKIPAGVDNDSIIRLSGQGEAGPLGVKPGDLYLKIKVKMPAHLSKKQKQLLEELRDSGL